MTPRLLERYREEIVPKLRGEFGYKNIHQVPGLVKARRDRIEAQRDALLYTMNGEAASSALTNSP